MPAISVIIPTYNRPRHLAMCLGALEGVAFPREQFEVIVVDDGGSIPVEITHTLDVTVVRQDNAGPGAARNTGAQRAQGQCLVFLDDDCLPEPDWLRALAARLEKGEREAVAGKTVNGCPDNLYDCVSHLLSYHQYDRYKNEPAAVEFLATNNLAMQADLFRAAGGFRPDLTLAYEDREFCDRWLRLGYRLAYAPEAVVRHCRSMTLRSFCRQHWTYGRMASRYYSLGPSHASSRIRRGLPQLYFEVARRALREHSGWSQPPILALLAASQVMAASGFLVERLR
jgi:GT2 family glycosyltransferase